MVLLRIADILLFWIHVVVILFNLTGWMVPKWRTYHIISMFLTLFSWLVPGIWYGLGYCFLTDWHWKVKRALGETNLPASFIKYFFDRYTPLDLTARTVDLITVGFFAAAFLVALILYLVKKGPKLF